MRNRFVLLADLPLIGIAAFGAFAARFDWRFFEFRPEFALYVVAALAIKPATFLALGMYRRYWQYASIQEVLAVVIGVTASSIAMAIFVVIASLAGWIPSGFSRVVFFTDWLLTLMTAGGLRLAIRIAYETHFRTRSDRADATRRALIVGAGAAGTMVTRELRRNPQLGLDPIGFLDDDPVKVGKKIAGIRVLGAVRSLEAIVRAHRVNTVIIAMPTARGSAVRAIVDACRQVGVQSQTVPGIFELLDGQVSINRLRNVEIADLLRRDPVDPDENAASFVAGRVVLITGGGGSIGAELARQIANARPAQLILLGHGENSVFEAEATLRNAFPQLRMSSVIADIRDEWRLATVFDRLRPSIVFHAAAHKHVPLMEENPEEAVTNNIVGTRHLVRQALRTQVERFVLISTDKAVTPTSIMGATKRVAEAIVRQAAAESGRAYVVVRFGNVLGSRGSVVNTFKDQIARGGPVTVTHPGMSRYFMTIPEAVHLVLQASHRGKSGELYVLDMGEPVRIVQLAQDLIKLSGLTEDDIPIVFTNARPGEKLEETVYERNARTVPTSHRQVLQVVGDDVCVGSQLDRLVDALGEAARQSDAAAIDDLLARTVPGFSRPSRLRQWAIPEKTH
jgi:FlaA1/EpsC-like NDP-sugar epimerase